MENHARELLFNPEGRSGRVTETQYMSNVSINVVEISRLFLINYESILHRLNIDAIHQG